MARNRTQAPATSQDLPPSPPEGADVEAGGTTPPPAVTPATPPAPVPVPVDPVRSVSIEVPLMPTDHYATTTLRVNRRTARVLRDVADGLSAQSLTLKSGKLVKDGSDALEWLCERISDGVRNV